LIPSPSHWAGGRHAAGGRMCVPPLSCAGALPPFAGRALQRGVDYYLLGSPAQDDAIFHTTDHNGTPRQVSEMLFSYSCVLIRSGDLKNTK
jgi:hypothetical protein